ncbi:MAG: hypothetical protein Q7U04_13285 [Bacteriovorax sp.]|nr:hypothetical protein [Bacteriovorax sp.]
MKFFLLIFTLAHLATGELKAQDEVITPGDCKKKALETLDSNVQTSLQKIARKSCESMNPCEPSTIQSCGYLLLENRKLDENKILSSILEMKKLSVKNEDLLSESFAKIKAYLDYNKECLLEDKTSEKVDNDFIKILTNTINKNPKFSKLNLISSNQYKSSDLLAKIALIKGRNNNKDVVISYQESKKILKSLAVEDFNWNSLSAKQEYILKTYSSKLEIKKISNSKNSDEVERKIQDIFDRQFKGKCTYEEILSTIKNDLLKQLGNENKCNDYIGQTKLNFDDKLNLCSSVCKNEGKNIHFKSSTMLLKNKQYKIARGGDVPSSENESISSSNKSSVLETSEIKSQVDSSNEPADHYKNLTDLPSVGRVDDSEVVGPESYNDLMSQINTINTKLNPGIGVGGVAPAPLSVEDISQLDEELKVVKEKMKKIDPTMGDSKGAAQKVSPEELAVITDKVKQLEEKLSSSSLQVEDVKKSISEAKIKTENYKAQMATNENQVKQLRRENENLRQENLQRERDRQREREREQEREQTRDNERQNDREASAYNGSIASNNSSSDNNSDSFANNTNAQAGRSIASVESSNAGKSPSGSNANSGIGLVSNSKAASETVGEKIIISRSEYQSYPFKLPENASEEEIISVLMKSNGKAVFLGENGVIDGKLEYDKMGKPKYKVKKGKIKIVEDEKKLGVEKSNKNSPKEEVKRVKLSELNQLLNGLK